MHDCTNSLAMNLCACVMPIFPGGKVLQYLINVGLYTGAIVVVSGIISFEPPKAPGDQVLPVSPASQCVMILSCQYFVVYRGIPVCLPVKDWLSCCAARLGRCCGAARPRCCGCGASGVELVLCQFHDPRVYDEGGCGHHTCRRCRVQGWGAYEWWCACHLDPNVHGWRVYDH